ncbi:DUF1189 domain-containing protein [Clostridium folliculivorans]|uniref:DUF1189 domain-containing protein n=1 Tax=Clostridium folliculivorans TaxID=2886038 RepID=A0A9W5Y3W1_9CLOT|nr:DUF1189 domain-containing protein [Clostridium folliculivorans]GKU26080.1 hypothetical protein CFOLD11_29070 [Clostridium folliculivorans]GKU28166.1 hypothetical protein CFB3_02720 [Clostridium folliculivorans]
MNIFKGFIKSFYDFKSYAIFRKQSAGKSFLYSIILALVFSIVAFAYPAYKVNTTMKDLSIEYNEKIPDFQIKNGQLEIPNNKNAEIVRDSGTFVLDNTSDIKLLSDKYKSGIIFGRDTVIVKSEGTVALDQKYSTLNMDFNKKDIGGILDSHGAISSAMFAILAFGFIIGLYFRAFIVAIIGTIFKGETTFGQRFKLSLYATTPSVVLSAIFSLVGVNFTGSSILLFVLGIVYLFMGIKGVSKSELKELVDEL